MKYLPYYAALFLFCSLPVFPAIDGTVTNRTTGKPEAGVEYHARKARPEWNADARNYHLRCRRPLCL